LLRRVSALPCGGIGEGQEKMKMAGQASRPQAVLLIIFLITSLPSVLSREKKFREDCDERLADSKTLYACI
jgi:hypothetical protein